MRRLPDPDQKKLPPHSVLRADINETLGKRTLEEVLAEKTDLDEQVSAEVRREMELYGVRVGAIALKDIMCPATSATS